jgi:PAS domain S-box-containing protein
MQFLVKLSAYISEVSYAKIQLEKEIKQRQNSEARLRESEDMLRGIFKTARTVSFIITDADDTEPVILEFSPGAEAIFGYKKKEVLGKPTSILHIPSDVKKFPEIHKQMSQGKTGFSGETTLIRKNGEKFHALFSSYPFFNKNGEMYAALGVTFDISKQKNLEAQLLQASKLESVGRLAGGIAHDFNNMLSVIIGNTEMLLEKSPAREIFTSHLKEIYNAAMDSADLTKQLLAYARKQTISPRVIDLNATVAGMTKMLKRLIGEDIELAWLPGEDLWPVRIDPSQLDQILANLCLNARDAIHGVGKVTIETSKADINDAYCAEHLDVLAGEYVLVAVSDNGCGMSAETQKNIFEPFYTTKVTGKGTGLGLATVYGVVKQNNGFVNVYSEPGHGSTLKIYFPRYQDQTEISSSQSNSSPKVDHGHETILLVEDELAILKMAKTMLEMTGYQVMAAETPTEAIRLARNHSGKINLLLTDVVMPEMNGLDLAKNILSFYPNLKLLFMSGYTANIIAKHGILNKGLNFMQKPFSRQTLGSKVRQALDED